MSRRARGGRGGDGGPVQIGKARVVLTGAVHGFGSQAHHNPEHPCVWVHIRVPFISTVAVAHSCCSRHKVFSIIRTGNSLHQNCHLFIFFIKPP